MPDDFKGFIMSSCDRDITPAHVRQLMDKLIEHRFSDAQVGAFLAAFTVHGLQRRPEIVAECARAMAAHAVQVPFPVEERQKYIVADIVGTGGDGHNTFNASTAASLVLSGCQHKELLVAKHGNRSSSSMCGSADLLEALGCQISHIQPNHVFQALKESGFCFLFAQTYHPAMKNIGPIRKQLGFPTIFNLLGPLANPLVPDVMVVGVNSRDLGPIFIQTLKHLGVKRALVVHGSEGLDEISPATSTYVWRLENDGSISEFQLMPSDFGLEPHALSEVVGGQPDHNAGICMQLLENQLPEGHPILDFVLMNASALLVTAGLVKDWKQGVVMARDAISSGRALKALEKFREYCKP